jgi:RNAse (barnase) inhibitor barstar
MVPRRGSEIVIINSNIAMFSLFIDDKNKLKVGSFSTIEGLGGELYSERHGHQIKLLNGFLCEPFLSKTIVGSSDIIISIFDNAGLLITSLTGVASEMNIKPNKKNSSVFMTGDGLPALLPEALPLLVERRNGFPIEHGRWLTLNHDEKEAWLEVSLLDNRKPAYKTKPIDIELDGKTIVDIVSFLCALGEAVFGPGGYIGRNLGALEDYLSCNTDLNVPFNLRWKNSRDSEKRFKDCGEEDIYRDILVILKNSGVNVILD